MNIAEIYDKFDKIGCLTFATIDGDRPQTRIAHLFAYDEEGLYFRTMITKAFYAQVKESEKVSVCGMYPKTTVSYNDDGMPFFDPGYTIRATGDTREIDLDTLRHKAEKNELFALGVKDTIKYPATATFCLYRAYGEVFDFDFEMENRDHKLLRIPFEYGDIKVPFSGMRISDKCIVCGECEDKCSFKAITMDNENQRYRINHQKCDVCGDCYIVCPNGAVEIIINEE